MNNSYFKINKTCGLPDTILEIALYEKQRGELPFKYSGSNWVYDAFCERQKYRGIQNSQFLTPDATADRMAHFAGKYFACGDVLEPCCGTGQITKKLLECGYRVAAFDVDSEMAELSKILHGGAAVERRDFREAVGRYGQIVANPPYETAELTDFLEWADGVQDCGGISILLLPRGFIDKDRPKRTFRALRRFAVLEREAMREEFARTKTAAEIAVLKKL